MNLNEDLYPYQQVRENYGSKIIRARYSNQQKAEGPESTGISPQKERTDSPFTQRPDHERFGLLLLGRLRGAGGNLGIFGMKPIF